MSKNHLVKIPYASLRDHDEHGYAGHRQNDANVGQNENPFEFPEPHSESVQQLMLLKLNDTGFPMPDTGFWVCRTKSEVLVLRISTQCTAASTSPLTIDNRPLQDRTID